MALARVKEFIAGEVLTAADLNNELNNILNNGPSLLTPITQNFDLDGFTLILDQDADTSIDSGVDDTIDFTISGADDFRMTANTLTALSGSSITVAAGTLNVTDGLTTLADPGSHTATVVTPLTIESTTSGSPAAGIGTGILFNSESSDENPSNVGQIEFAFSDVGTGSEDSYFQVLLRVAGAALTACYRFVATGAFKAIFTHANSTDRTYTLPNRDMTIGAGDTYIGPSSTGSGSSRSHEGTVTVSSNGNYSGIHYYTNFTLDSGNTMTVPAGKKRLIIIATGTITISGTIAASGAGGAGGAAGGAGDGGDGAHGTDQAGGGGGGGTYSTSGGDGGSVLSHGCVIQAGGAGGAPGTAGTQLTGSDLALIAHAYLATGGAGGGGSTYAGGAGGGSIVLIAPIVVLAASATLNTSGGAGVYSGGNADGAGGGGAGNIYIICRSYTDSGATFTQTAGAAGTNAGGGSVAGAAGAAGQKQILIFN